jgi:maltoporin
MRRVVRVLGLAAWCVSGLLSSHAFAQDAADTDAQTETSEPKEAEQAEPGGPTTTVPKAERAAPTAAVAPANPIAPVEARPVGIAAPSGPPKFGDTTLTGYFRGSFGASNQKGRMTCFSLALPGGLHSKYRLGNECEVWTEAHFTTVVYAGDKGVVASFHFMPTVYIPTTFIGYSPNGTTSSPSQNSTATGATISFPNMYVDIKGIPWLFGGTAWMGTRYYKRESVYISDFFYWNPSGVGAGIEDVKIWKDMKLSYGIFAVDGEPVSSGAQTPSLPNRTDLGFRNDVQLRGIKPYASGEFQVGFQYIADFSAKNADGKDVTNGGWGLTLQHVQQVLGGENKLAVQYGRGGGTGFGTLARFYYPDFSLAFAPSESRIRALDVITIEPTDWFGAQANVVFQHDDLGASGKTDWWSAGTRLAWGFTKHAKLIGEAGYDHVKKTNGSDPQWLAKLTIAPAITVGKGFFARPELRLFYTWATWNQPAAVATVDSGSLYTYPDANGVFKLSGSTFGAQAETWW